MQKIGAFWKYTKEDGTIYFKGRIDFPANLIIGEDTDILLFKNKSDHEKSPALDLLIAKRQPRKPQPAAQSSANGESAFDDDVPF